MDPRPSSEQELIQYVHLKLVALGFPAPADPLLDVARPLLRIHHEKNKLLSHLLCPADQRIQDFLEDHLRDSGGAPRLPDNTFMLDRPGMARLMSLPLNGDEFISEQVSSYRVRQGVLHNPRKDRRTTAGVFHVAEGGLPIPNDKKAVPKAVFGRLLAAAASPPEELLRLPFTAGQAAEARLFLSLSLRPVVCPEVPGLLPRKSLEIRFFAPGGLVSNLDFVESIFGNAGNSWLPENDAALDPEHWTGHTGCVILAPHLTTLRKKDLGLPPFDQATERQRRDGMCWKAEDERYNEGQPFKVTSRDVRGVIVTLIADNYFGYCKKEVKTQISYSANLYGWAEEEHSGGAVAFPSYDLGEEFHLEDGRLPQNGATFRDVATTYGAMLEIKPEGYGVDKRFPDVVYVPEDARFNLLAQSISWAWRGQPQKIKLLADKVYVLPSGYKVRMKKEPRSSSWHLVGTSGEGTFCHKPCTVSGGGKSEISKSIEDAMMQGPFFVVDFQKDMDTAAQVIGRRFGDQFHDPARNNAAAARPLLSESRSLGSVIKLLTFSPEYTDAHNAWLELIPRHVKELVFAVKRYHDPAWGEDWRSRFGVDAINGRPGHELKLGDKKLVASYIRVGFAKDGAWRTYKVRQDFMPAEKLQMEDDITVSVTVPGARLEGLPAACPHPSVKIVENVERRLFQRPDDCIHRGYDRQAEKDLTSPGVFLSNFEPLRRERARDFLEDAIGFDQWSGPVQRLVHDAAGEGAPAYFVSPAHPRIVDGKPSKNPRYLQERPDLMDPRARYLAETGARLFRRLPLQKPVLFPVSAVLAGRRNNPPEPALHLPPLAVSNPIHYQELPELFMDFICSLTGKSPSTTGFGSEGALTKGPFNALLPVVDLNNALVSYILTGYDGFSSAAGWVGPHVRVDHDISLLVPEIWCRMTVQERDPRALIDSGCLEPLRDTEYKGRTIPVSRLGHRITDQFVRRFLGRIFNNPGAVFTPELLKPETQDLDVFMEGVEAIAAAQKRVAEGYFADGSVGDACPPLKALLHIMVQGAYEGRDIHHPEIRALFTRDNLLDSSWYRERIRAQQSKDVALWERHAAALSAALAAADGSADPSLRERLSYVQKKRAEAASPAYVEGLLGALGADPSLLAPDKAAPSPASVAA